MPRLLGPEVPSSHHLQGLWDPPAGPISLGFDELLIPRTIFLGGGVPSVAPSWPAGPTTRLEKSQVHRWSKWPLGQSTWHPSPYG